MQSLLNTRADTGSNGPKKRGGDLHTVVGLDLREASVGVETVVSVAAQGTCAKCQVRKDRKDRGDLRSRSERSEKDCCLKTA